MSGRISTNERQPGGEGKGLCACDLLAQTEAFAGTGGVSRNNRHAGFLPGYLNSVTGETHRSCFADGRPAPVHVLEGLPDHWIGQRDAAGDVVSAAPGIVAGFLRDGRFFSRADAAREVAAEAVA